MIRDIFKIALFFIFISSHVIAENNDTTRFLDINYLMQNSLVGKSMISQLNAITKSNQKIITEEAEKLKSEEKKIVAQKNVISEKEFQANISKLQSKVLKFKKNRNKLITDFNQKKINAEAQLLSQLSTILSEYLEKNNISFVLQKKNILMGKSELDITKEVVKIFDKKIKKVNIK